VNITNIADQFGLTDRAVTTNGRRAAIRLSRSFDTAADDLWQACTDADRMSRWIGVATGEFHEGGTVRLCMTPPDQDVAMLEIIRCDAPRRLVVRWSEAGKADSFVEMNLSPGPGGDATTLSLEHIALSGTLPKEYGGGWEDFLIRLGALLAGGDPNAHSWGDVEQQLFATWNEAMVNAPDDGRWPSVVGTDDGSTLTACHSYPASRADVWAALTNADRLSVWMAPTSGDLRVGGEWTMTFDNGSASGTVAECEPDERLVTTWAWAHEPDRAPSTVTVELSDAPGGGTVVELRQDAASTPGEGYAAGWYAYLRNLDRHVSRHAAAESVGHADADWQADWAEAMAMIRP